jgi:hypothetical protein
MAVNTAIPPPNAQLSSLKLTTRPSRVCENRILSATKCHTRGTSMDKSQRGRLHEAINDLSAQDVAGIVKQSFPRAKAGKIDQLARDVIAKAHRQVSPRLPRKTG